MLRHYLLLIYRNFLRAKSYFLINMAGLSTGLACTLLIYLWVRDEFGVNKFHEKDAQLFEVMEHQQYADAGLERAAGRVGADRGDARGRAHRRPGDSRFAASCGSRDRHAQTRR